MITYRFRPLRWSGPSTPAHKRRSRSTFSASYRSTLTLLERELDWLKARDVVIEADFTEADIRVDGLIRANARQPSHPGVRVAFGSVYGPLVYATDAHEFWQHNLRGVALGLEALRKVDRYGVSSCGEQYTGWRQLPSATPMPGPMTAEDAARVYVLLGGGDATRIVTDQGHRADVYRRAARAAHPDTGGTKEGFQRLQDAKRVLDGGS